MGPFLFWVFTIEAHSVSLKLIVAAFEGKRKRKKNCFQFCFLLILGLKGLIFLGKFVFSGFSCFRMCPCAVGNIEYLLD